MQVLMPPAELYAPAGQKVSNPAVVRREAGDQTDQESKSAGHGAATSLTAMDVTIHASAPGRGVRPTSGRLLDDLGPGAGHDGGRIVFEGTPADLVAARSTLTGEHLGAYAGT
jgi:hypothetical protein